MFRGEHQLARKAPNVEGDRQRECQEMSRGISKFESKTQLYCVCRQMYKVDKF